MIKDSKKYSIILINRPGIISKEIFLFTLSLLKNIFILQKNSESINDILDDWIIRINKSIIKKEAFYINKEYSYKNLKNIIFFIKNQNLKYYADIIEIILIYIFSKAFEVKRDNSFCKYIFNNLNKINSSDKNEFIYWIQKTNLKPNEFNNLEELFNNDDRENDNNLIKKQENSIFYDFIVQIYKNKYDKVILTKSEKNKKYINYINNTNYTAYDILLNIYKVNLGREKYAGILDKDILTNSIMNIFNNISKPFSKKNKPLIQPLRSFFTQVYIFYQNMHSSLRQYAFPKEEYARIPFCYDLRGACIDGRYSHIVLGAIKGDNYIENILLKQNNLREGGLYELGKICIFNNSIKLLECDSYLLRTPYFFFLINSMGIFNNYSVEEINFSSNYLKEDSEEFLIKIIKKFKELKTLNISMNDIKKGLANFFVALKVLYRQKKTKLENLIINKCSLDTTSLIELGELIKCKFCKLKKISLNNNIIQENSNFFKNLKKNKNLEKIYLNKCDINDSFIDNILKIISNTNIRYLYLYKNKLNNFNNFLRIIYRTKIIQKKNNNSKIIISNDNNALINLDLSNNNYPIKNATQITLLQKILEETSLYCLDICHILYGINPDKIKEVIDSKKYKENLENLIDYLKMVKSNYENTIKEIRINKVDISRLNYLKNDKNLEKYQKDENFDKIWKNKDAIYPIYLKTKVEEIIKDEDENEEIMDKLVNYLILKRSENKLKELEANIYKKKLIII